MFLIIIGIVNFFISATLFIYLRRVGKFEREKMLGLSVLILHSKEYTEDYNKKIREIMGDQDNNENNNNNFGIENNLYNLNDQQN